MISPAFSPALSAFPRAWRSACCTAVASLLMACASPSTNPVQTAYDFGPATGQGDKASAGPLPALALAGIDSPLAQHTTAMQYRLSYANAQELRPYGLARWSMPPGQLVQQRLRARLASQGPVVELGQASAAYTLQVALEEFSQQFETPSSSQGLVQLRATLLKGNALVAQQSFSARAPAPTPDAAGGVRALTLATDEAAQALASWIAQHMR